MAQLTPLQPLKTIKLAPLGSGKAPSKNPWGPDIFSNLLDDVQSAVHNIPSGLFYMGKTLVGDAGNLLTGSHNPYKTDDMVHDLVTTTWHDTKARWTPLFTGNFDKFWKGLDAHPLDYGLDLATLATGGGAAVSKLGHAAADAGHVGTLSKLAGLSKTERTLADATRVSIGHGVDPAAAAVTAGREQRVLGGLIDKHGSVWDGPVGKLQSGDKQISIPLAHNPIIRMRQQAVIATGNRFPRIPMIGAHSKSARLEATAMDRVHGREQSVVTRAADDAAKALSPEDARAFELANFRQQGIGRDTLITKYEGRLSVAAKVTSKIEAKVAKEGGRPLTSAEAGDVATVAAITDRLSLLKDDAAWQAADQQHWSDPLRNAMHHTHELSKWNTHQLWELSGRKTRSGQDISFADFFDLQRTREARHLHDPETNLLDQVSKTEHNAFNLAADYQRAQGIGDYAFVRPHMASSEILGKQRLGTHMDGNGIKRPTSNRAKKNSFTLFDDALDTLDPRTVIDAAKQVSNYHAGIQKYEAVIASSREVNTLDEVHALEKKGWELIKADKKLDNLDAMIAWSSEDAKVMFGESDELRGMGETLAKLREKVSSGRMMAPSYMVKELLGDIEQSGKFIRGYDRVTRAWRTSTLTLRPVWISGNIVGQYSLLVATHGPIKAMGSLIQAARQGTKGIDLLGGVAPDVVSVGMVQSALDEFRHNQHKFIGKNIAQVAMSKTEGVFNTVAEKILNINAILSDDYPRRAAFLSEIRPHVKAIRAATGMSFEDAAREFLKSPDVVDRLATKVLGDLVNFKTLTRVEKNVLRRLMPFYSWISGSTSRTWRILADEPHKALMAAYVSGYGKDQLEAEFGPLPTFLQGMLPFGHDKNGHERIVNTNSMNPFNTFGDVAGMAKATLLGDVSVGGSNPASTLNPFLKSGIEAFTGNDLFYGTPIDRNGHSSYGQRFLGQAAKSFPIVGNVQKAIAPERPNALFDKNLQDQLLAYFAAPVKHLNVQRANARAAQDASKQTLV